MATKARGELLDVRDIVNLTVSFIDSDGYYVDPTIIPSVTIVQPNGSILIGPTSTGVIRVSEGNYMFPFTIPINGPYGVFQDVWTALIDSFQINNVFSFVVTGTNTPSVQSDGYKHLGDEVPFNYSQVAINNINKLIKMMKARLNSSGKVKIKDTFGNDQWVTCDIFSIETLVTFLAMALSYFNSIPYFTYFTFDDEGFIAQFGEILVEGAVAWAMASQALIERGREYSISDNGIQFTPPTVSELLNTQSAATMTAYENLVKNIKLSLRPASLGLGVFSISSGSNPAIKRLRHLSARKVY